MKDIQKMKKAFTLIEILVSVMIVSFIVASAMSLFSKNQEMAVYIKKRASSELDNSLFVTTQGQKYNKDEKNAYDILADEFVIDEMESRDVLKKISKKINVTPARTISLGSIASKEDDEQSSNPPAVTFKVNEIRLNGIYPARYFQFGN